MNSLGALSYLGHVKTNTHPKQALRQVRKDFIISILALISVGIGLYDVARPRLNSKFTPLDGLDLFIVFIFIVDFIGSARGSGNWRRYLKTHWWELPSLIPVTGNMTIGAEAVPILRGLRLIRLVRILRLLRVVGTAARLRAFWNKVLRIAERAHLAWLTIFAGLFILCGAGFAWLFEGSSNPAFRGGESLWWAVNMFSNVAYVESHPITLAGRIIAAILEFSGIGFIGLFTASLANALLTDQPQQEEETHPLD